MTHHPSPRAPARGARYVLVTPVKDEVKLIGQTIEAVLAQTVRPQEWVIASDGSTDGTNEVIERYARQHPWIRLLPLPPRVGRDFAAVVKNTERALRELSVTDYAYVGLLDSDVTFAPTYFETLLDRFAANPRLGLAGGVVIDVGLPKDKFPLNRWDVPGAVQFFRRECFESLGGLIAIPEGGWDALTCARARMNGYETRLFVDLVVDHHKPRNIAHGGPLKRRWQLGVRDHALGYHPLFEAAKCAAKMRERPWIVGGVAWWLGYCAACLSRRPRLIPADVLAYVRAEQRARLRGQAPGASPTDSAPKAAVAR